MTLHELFVNHINNTSSQHNEIITQFMNAKLKDRNLQRISSVIYDNEQTIKQIDKIINFYTTEKKVSSAQLYIDNKDIRQNDLINTKVALQRENEDLKNENLTSEQTVMVINEANVLVENKSLLSNLMIYYPILFLVIYVLISLLIGLYSYLDKLDRAS